MRILHLCLSNWYIDNVSYKENEIIREHVANDHDVTVIASTEVLGSDGKLIYTNPCKYMGSEGANVIRLSYVNWLPHLLSRKLRIYSDLFNHLLILRP